jgi:hypothetical protein
MLLAGWGAIGMEIEVGAKICPFCPLALLQPLAAAAVA